MAQVTRVELVDDLDGSEAEETIPFALDGVSYEIDLSSENADELREAFAPYLEAGRRTGGRRTRRTEDSPARGSRAAAAKGNGASHDSAAVRAWAAENGVEVGAKGRIPRAVLDQYEAANA